MKFKRISMWVIGTLLASLAAAPHCLNAQEPVQVQVQQVQIQVDPQAVIEEMDAELAAKALAAYAKVQEWRGRIARAQAAAKAIDGAKGDPEELAKVVLELAPELKTLATSHPKIAAIIRYQERVEGVLREADQAWRTAKYEADKVKDLDEKQFREAAKREAMAIASAKLREYFGSEVFVVIEAYRDPASYAENFLNGQFKEWISKPMKVDDEGELMVKVIPPPAGVSVFSKKARLGVEIDYLPGQLKVQATGLYFQYRPGALPTPITDELKVEVDYSQTVVNNVKALGEEMIAEALGAPIKVTLKDRPDFSRGQGMRGGIRFDVQFNMFERVVVQGTDLVLYPGNKIDWKNGTLKMDYKLDTPIPIPPAPAFAFWTIGGEFGPKTGEVAFQTKISTTATPPEVVALAVRCGTKFPVKYIEVNGTLLIANIGLAEAAGKLDFSKGTLDASFKSSEGVASLIPGFSLGEGKLHLQREYLTVDSKMEMFGTKFDEMHGEFSFVDGSGTLTSGGGFDLFGVDFAHELQAEIGSRFSYLTLRSVSSVEVSGIKPYGSLDCTVIVEGDSRNGDTPLKVIVKTFRPELDVTIPVVSFRECTIDLLRRELNKKAVQAYHQFLKDLANGDKETRRLAAQWDAKSRNWVAQHMGGAWETGVPELDNLGGQLSQEWKNAGGAVSGLTQQIGGGAADLSHTLQGGLKKADPTTNPTIQSWGNKLGI